MMFMKRSLALVKHCQKKLRNQFVLKFNTNLKMCSYDKISWFTTCMFFNL